MPAPREVEARIDWFLQHDPSGPGMCSQHTWHSLGGDQGNPPAWGCSDANAVIAKVRQSFRYWIPSDTDGPPPRGAAVYWEYGSNGHAALSLGDGRILPTDPSNGQPTGIEPLNYPQRWGYGGSEFTLWTDQYNGVTFEVGGSAVDIYNYKYSGKSEDTKEIPLNEYTWVTKDTDDPSASGLEFKLIYLNVKLRWAREGFGNIRVKFIREGGDDTAYQDYLVHSTQTDFLLTNMHMESGEKGIGGKWYIKVSGDALASAAVDTRYNKYATIKDQG